jgi:hypothetical protein
MQHEVESPVKPPSADHVETEELLLDKLASYDRPSLYAAGLVVTQALKLAGVAVMMTDVLGRVHLVPAGLVEVKRKPKLSDEVLNMFSEDEALALLLKQEEDEDSIVQYMQRRSASHEEGL